jgi:hypothetical protein
MALTGLQPTTILDCVRHALNFWTYQKDTENQYVVYQATKAREDLRKFKQKQAEEVNK